MPKRDETMRPDLLAKFHKHVDMLWSEHSDKFFKALEESENKKLMLHFRANFDLSEAIPVCVTNMTFQDKTQESGMDVTKHFHAEVKEKIDDPAQPPLPGADVPRNLRVEKPKNAKKGAKKDTKKDAGETVTE